MFRLRQFSLYYFGHGLWQIQTKQGIVSNFQTVPYVEAYVSKQTAYRQQDYSFGKIIHSRHIPLCSDIVDFFISKKSEIRTNRTGSD